MNISSSPTPLNQSEAKEVSKMANVTLYRVCVQGQLSLIFGNLINCKCVKESIEVGPYLDS